MLDTWNSCYDYVSGISVYLCLNTSIRVLIIPRVRPPVRERVENDSRINIIVWERERERESEREKGREFLSLSYKLPARIGRVGPE